MPLHASADTLMLMAHAPDTVSDTAGSSGADQPTGPCPDTSLANVSVGGASIGTSGDGGGGSSEPETVSSVTTTRDISPSTQTSHESSIRKRASSGDATSRKRTRSEATTISQAHAHAQGHLARSPRIDITYLPREVLVRTFLHLVPHGDAARGSAANHTDKNGLFALMDVSRLFRDIVAREPRFWEHLSIRLGAVDAQLAATRFAQYLQTAATWASQVLSHADADVSPAEMADGDIDADVPALGSDGRRPALRQLRLAWINPNPVNGTRERICTYITELFAALRPVSDTIERAALCVVGATSSHAQLLWAILSNLISPASAYDPASQHLHLPARPPQRALVRLAHLEITMPRVKGFEIKDRFLLWFSHLESVRIYAGPPFVDRDPVVPHGPVMLPILQKFYQLNEHNRQLAYNRRYESGLEDAHRRHNEAQRHYERSVEQYKRQVAQQEQLDDEWIRLGNPLDVLGSPSAPSDADNGDGDRGKDARLSELASIHLTGCFIWPELVLPSPLNKLTALTLIDCKWGTGFYSFLLMTPNLVELKVVDLQKDWDEFEAEEQASMQLAPPSPVPAHLQALKQQQQQQSPYFIAPHPRQQFVAKGAQNENANSANGHDGSKNMESTRRGVEMDDSREQETMQPLNSRLRGGAAEVEGGDGFREEPANLSQADLQEQRRRALQRAFAALPKSGSQSQAQAPKSVQAQPQAAIPTQPMQLTPAQTLRERFACQPIPAFTAHNSARGVNPAKIGGPPPSAPLQPVQLKQQSSFASAFPTPASVAMSVSSYSSGSGSGSGSGTGSRSNRLHLPLPPPSPPALEVSAEHAPVRTSARMAVMEQWKQDMIARAEKKVKSLAHAVMNDLPMPASALRRKDAWDDYDQVDDIGGHFFDDEEDASWYTSESDNDRDCRSDEMEVEEEFPDIPYPDDISYPREIDLDPETDYRQDLLPESHPKYAEGYRYIIYCEEQYLQSQEPVKHEWYSKYDFHEVRSRREESRKVVRAAQQQRSAEEGHPTATAASSPAQPPPPKQFLCTITLPHLRRLELRGEHTPLIWINVDESEFNEGAMPSGRSTPAIHMPNLRELSLAENRGLDQRSHGLLPEYLDAAIERNAAGSKSGTGRYAPLSESAFRSLVFAFMSGEPIRGEPSDEELFEFMSPGDQWYYRDAEHKLPRFREQWRSNVGLYKPGYNRPNIKMIRDMVNGVISFSPPARPFALSALTMGSPDIEHLDLSGSNCPGDVFGDAVRHLPNLARLELQRVDNIYNDHLLSLSDFCPRLASIDVRGSRGLNAHGVAPLVHQIRDASEGHIRLLALVDDPELYSASVPAPLFVQAELRAFKYLVFVGARRDPEVEEWQEAARSGRRYSTKRMKKEMKYGGRPL